MSFWDLTLFSTGLCVVLYLIFSFDESQDPSEDAFVLTTVANAENGTTSAQDR